MFFRVALPAMDDEPLKSINIIVFSVLLNDYFALIDCLSSASTSIAHHLNTVLEPLEFAISCLAENLHA